MRAERRFHAMGSDAHVIVLDRDGRPDGDADRLALAAERRVTDLERRWSRFEAASEVSALNRNAGSPVVVSPDTLELVERALTAWRLTGGRFDPTVLGALVRAGYDRSFEAIDRTSRGTSSALTTNAEAIEIVGNTVRLPAGSGFDPGGIGKGLAADIVADELRSEGAAGVCVNLGGDIRVDGNGPAGNAWSVAIDFPGCARPIGRVGIAQGAVATSTTLRRRWNVDGEARHHLIDPATGRPSAGGLTFVTVVAGQAWVAEVLAKAILLNGARRPFDLLAGTGAAAIAIDRDGRVVASAGMSAYLADSLPDVIALDLIAPEGARRNVSVS